MSFDGCVCFFILYHYESNAIFITPIVGLDNMSIFNAYKGFFDNLMAKCCKLKLNIMDSQATWYIPHNHRVNTAKWAIQTFKVAFIATLGTTDSKFPLKLWDRHTPQVNDTLNMLCALQIDPTVLAYDIINCPYD
jgi:hypothetical protein